MSGRNSARKLQHESASSTNEADLHKLMLESLSGNGASYANLLERIAQMVRQRLQRSRRVSPEQVEDLVQEVLLAVHTKRDTYRTDLPLRNWLQTITRYKLIDSIRAQGRHPVCGDIDLDLFADDGAGPDQNVATHSDLETLLSTLPEKQREVLRLAKVEEVPLKEIGERMGMSVANVKVTVHRALAALKKNSEETPRE